MPALPAEIFRRWSHSFEEDMGGITIYRPTEYNFPRARGRAGIEFKRDGTFIQWEIAPTDANRGINGHWRIEGSGQVYISFEENTRPQKILEILQIDATVLKVRMR